MWPFRRKPIDSKQVPPEVQQYYDSEHRERVGLAWLIAFLSLIVTIVVIVGLFFGSRWVYRKIANRNNTPTTAPEGTGLEQPAQPPAQSTTPSTPNSLQPAAPSQNQTGSSSSSSTGSSSSTSSSSTGTSSISTTIPSTATTKTNITNTGPGDTAAIFIGVTVLAAVAHSVYSRRKAPVRN